MDFEKIANEALSVSRILRNRLDLADKSGLRHFTGGKSPAQARKKGEALAELQNQASECRKCEIGRQRTNLVFGRGNPDADLVFIGEAPGYHEDRQGLPFVGRAGQLLDKIIVAMGFDVKDVYIGNILKCRPEGNRNPSPQEIVRCMAFLEKQIEIISPKVICAVGGIASKSLLSTQKSIGALRGRFHEFRGIPLMATYHPAYLLRNPSDKKKTWEDVQKIRDFLLL
ncbi:MAG: uracil-DNA glycosylase [Planctomycetota bacterium]|nr:MAG: uracil-DNA glycosylase [Planctomycetota bacterium]